MTKRGNQLNMQHEHIQALRELEEKRPKGEEYTIFAENGSQGGRMAYNPIDDTLTIEAGTASTKIEGQYLNSIYKALGDLLSEMEATDDHEG
ncbi:MAG: hypothetical protein LBB89_12315 [Treponema sp.]|jgi:hypothetical protein|nr:hypothetical protein [Treponema sp.]